MSLGPILLYDPEGGVVTGDDDGGGIGQRQGHLYYWPDIQNLTGGVAETDLDAQNISALPEDSLIIVVIESSGESTWLRANDATSPVTDTNTGVIVPTNYDAVERPYVLRRQIGCALSDVVVASDTDTECNSPWLSPTACSPPVGACVHYVSFQVRLTQQDIDNDYSDLFELGVVGHTGGHNINVFVSSSQWRFSGGFAGDFATLDITPVEVPLVACQCYDVLAGFNDPGTPSDIEMFFCINGVSHSTNVARGASFFNEVLSDFAVGDIYGGDAVVNRKYRRLIVSPGFDLATDSFDSLVDASVVTEESENVLLVNSGAAIGYAQKTVAWTIACP